MSDWQQQMWDVLRNIRNIHLIHVDIVFYFDMCMTDSMYDLFTLHARFYIMGLSQNNL